MFNSCNAKGLKGYFSVDEVKSIAERARIKGAELERIKGNDDLG